MRRPRVRTLLVFLLLGAILNIAVAWIGEYRDTDLARTIAALKQRVNTTGFIEYSEDYYRQHAPEPLPVVSGWPAHSLYRRSIVEFANMPRTSSLELGIAVPKPPALLGVRTSLRLAVLPLWPGFAINTVFYAAILWIIFIAPSALRRRLRLRRGHCPICNYDLRGTPEGNDRVCPECGTAAPEARSLP